jgi:hypothetical protein
MTLRETIRVTPGQNIAMTGDLRTDTTIIVDDDHDERVAVLI